MDSRKAQASGSAAGTVVVIILSLIIFYILFLPPEDRAALLGEESGSPGQSSGTGTPSGSSIVNKTLLSISPGVLDHNSRDNYEYDLPSVNLFSRTETRVIGKFNNFYIKNSWFDKITKTFEFDIKDAENTNNLMISFSVKEGNGLLGIKVNSNEVYYYKTTRTDPDPIKINKEMLKEGKNTLTFYVSGTGMSFWKVNEYYIENLQVIADITDRSRDHATSNFYLTSDEIRNIETSELRFSPECRQADIGYLEAYINGYEVFKAVPDCGMFNTIIFDKDYLREGKNSVEFRTDKGSYLIDRVSVKNKLEDPLNPTYYFSIDDNLFIKKPSSEPKCGEIDDICPDGCDADSDKDCCFEKYDAGYWCDIPTSYEGDRCVGFVDSCSRCPSGYEDRYGRIAENCKETCGDDSDGECPSGCQPKYDKDCCFDLSGDQYWCEDLPVSGADFICVNSVSQSSCKLCTTGYDGEKSDPECEKDTESDEEDKLRSGVHIVLKVLFTQSGTRKEAEIWINGKKTGFETFDSEWIKTIDNFVVPDDNSIKVIPKTDLEIRQIKVEIKD